MRHLANIPLLPVVVIFLMMPAAVVAGALESVQGEPEAPILELGDLNQRVHRLSDYQGKVVLVNFWATWCTPCVTEMPGMQRLADTLKEQPFEILAVNVSDAENRVREFLRRMNLGLTVLLDRNGHALRAWHGTVLPTSVLVDGTGRVRYRASGPLEWDGGEVRQIIEELIQDN